MQRALCFMMTGVRSAMPAAPMGNQHILFPHDANATMVTGLRRMLVHSSIREIQELGHYDRYCALIPSQSLAQIGELIGPGSMPIALALDHYQACDLLGLSDEQIHEAGERAGDNIGDALMVASKQHATMSESSAWGVIGAFYRMSRRIYDGGSSQYVKLGPSTLQIEYKLNPLFSIRYYRTAYGGFIQRAFGKAGLEVEDLRLSAYAPQQAEITARIHWKVQ